MNPVARGSSTIFTRASQRLGWKTSMASPNLLRFRLPLDHRRVDRRSLAPPNSSASSRSFDKESKKGGFNVTTTFSTTIARLRDSPLRAHSTSFGTAVSIGLRHCGCSRQWASSRCGWSRQKCVPRDSVLVYAGKTARKEAAMSPVVLNGGEPADDRITNAAFVECRDQSAKGSL